MIIVKTGKQLKNHTDGKQVGFVPTMGALHEGHLSLVAESRNRGLFTVVSIFVNPTQFNNPEDLAKYPRDTEADLHKLRAAGCDLVFLPEPEEIYPPGTDQKRYIHDFGHLEHVFEGHFRPGHFRGVGQVVHILFEIVRPELAFFGEKDFQQLQVIKRLVALMDAPIEIVGMPTVREHDGLAMSSRNRRLSPEARQAASVLYTALEFARKNIRVLPPDRIRAEAEHLFNRAGVKLEYFEIIDEDSFCKAENTDSAKNLRGIVAAYAGGIRLIDNMRLA